jgi:CubicO group peptidase (beta-lactamase class C family)
MAVTTLDRVAIEGHVSPGFVAVREAFVENFIQRGERGGACCVYLRGRKVVDLWGGVRNKSTGEPWEQDTIPGVAASAGSSTVPSTHGFYDECLKGEVPFSLGFMKPSPLWPFGSRSAFGSPGAGGALGFADPSSGVGYAYVTSQMGTTLTGGDPRELALHTALGAALRTA